MFNLKVLPYNGGSESAKDLAQLLNCIRVKPNGNYVPKHLQTVLNWGYSGVPSWMSRALARSVRVLNKPECVNVAANKLSSFQVLQRNSINIPEFTTDINMASRWLHSGATVVERHNLRGNSGDGIRIVNLDDDAMPSVLERAPLYTKFVNKTNEFRVHVFRGQVIDMIEKKRVPADRRPANFNRYISSVNFGWVFSRTNVRDIPAVTQLALRAVTALGLDFGAVDVMYADGQAYILEVNCAPGLKNETLVKYANAIRRFMGVSDLPISVPAVNNVSTSRPVAAHVAQVDRGPDLVTLTMDRGLARQLRSLLANV